ncbi:sugar phosphate isomerase/epimerase [bacterium]|nr:sugar phosphate isomerase/epimerase [candidate division CSSED10-310 bacterium]
MNAVMEPFCHVPFHQLERYAAVIERFKLPLEVYLPNHVVRRQEDRDYAVVGEWLTALNLPITVHGPFQDLIPAAYDDDIRELTIRRLVRGVEAAALLGAERYLLHLNCEPWKYDCDESGWLEHVMRTLNTVCEELDKHGMALLMENTFESDPTPFQRVFSTLGYHRAGFCMDIAHTELFSKALASKWVEALMDRLVHVHMSDHHGIFDEHLPLGRGTIDFESYFDLFRQYGVAPTFTFEFGGIEAIQESRGYLHRVWWGAAD